MKSFKIKQPEPKLKPKPIISVVYPKEKIKFNPPLRLFSRNVWSR